AVNGESVDEPAGPLLSQEPGLDCLFCATDTIAIGALQYCRSQGIRVPDALMLAAVGDSLAGRVAYVPLTSVQLHYRTAGRLAAGMLLDHLAHPHAAPDRSEEHTSELQSRFDIVCRLRLEKKHKRPPNR